MTVRIYLWTIATMVASSSEPYFSTKKVSALMVLL
jgi:hypothetical protein